MIEKFPVVFSLDGKTLTAGCEIESTALYEVDEEHDTRSVHSHAVNRTNGMEILLGPVKSIDGRNYYDVEAHRIVALGKKRRE